MMSKNPMISFVVFLFSSFLCLGWQAIDYLVKKYIYENHEPGEISKEMRVMSELSKKSFDKTDPLKSPFWYFVIFSICISSLILAILNMDGYGATIFYCTIGIVMALFLSSPRKDEVFVKKKVIMIGDVVSPKTNLDLNLKIIDITPNAYWAKGDDIESRVKIPKKDIHKLEIKKQKVVK